MSVFSEYCDPCFGQESDAFGTPVSEPDIDETSLELDVLIIPGKTYTNVSVNFKALTDIAAPKDSRMVQVFIDDGVYVMIDWNAVVAYVPTDKSLVWESAFKKMLDDI